MRASQTHTPQPLPPPPLSLPLTPSTAPRRRHRATSSSSASTASSSFSPSPSLRTMETTSVVPFSWERHPGIPKSSLAGHLASSGSVPLPLPPPLRPSPRHRRQRRRRRADVPSSAVTDAADPFAAAFVECAREEGTDDANADVADKLWPAPTPPALSGRPGRPWWLAGGGVVGFLDLYGCKSAMDAADGTFRARRPVAARPGGPGRATRR